MACFDFLGCGNSDGDYITMGEEEKYQTHITDSKLNEKKIRQLIFLKFKENFLEDAGSSSIPWRETLYI